MTRALAISLNTVPALNNDLQNLFSPDAFNKNAFTAADATDTMLTALGRQLFFEKALSGNYSRSCASCHIPDKYFQDGLARNRTFDNGSSLPRNTPGLLYSSYQYSQFWDGRAKNLNEQAVIVLHNKKEMDGDDDSITKRLQSCYPYNVPLKKYGRINLDR